MRLGTSEEKKKNNKKKKSPHQKNTQPCLHFVEGAPLRHVGEAVERVGLAVATLLHKRCEQHGGTEGVGTT